MAQFRIKVSTIDFRKCEKKCELLAGEIAFNKKELANLEGDIHSAETSLDENVKWLQSAESRGQTVDEEEFQEKRRDLATKLAEFEKSKAALASLEQLIKQTNERLEVNFESIQTRKEGYDAFLNHLQARYGLQRVYGFAGDMIRATNIQ